MKTIKELFDSKKFVTALLAVVTEIALKLGVPELTVPELTTIISPFLAYIGAQGFADVGKARAEAKAKGGAA